MLRDFIARSRLVAVAFAAAALSIAPLASCGVKGPLKLPPAPAAGVPATDSQSAPPAESPATPAPKPPETRP